MTAATTPTANAFRLNPEETFPHLSAQKIGGGTLDLPEALAGSWSVVLFYRGHWCPFCRSQLSDFQKHSDEYTAAGVKVVALSVDAEENAQQTVSRHSLTFPVAYGLDPMATSVLVGTYTSDGNDGHPTYIQATGFLVTPGGQVALALYSSGAVGRLNATETLGMVKYIQQKA